MIRHDDRGAFVRTTLYKAMRLPDGRHVCVHPEYLPQTTRVVSTEADYLILEGQGWTDHPQKAIARLEAEEDQRSEDAAVRAYDDRHLSESAQAEVEAVARTTIRHLPEIPTGPKKRGRPKKVIVA